MLSLKQKIKASPLALKIVVPVYRQYVTYMSHRPDRGPRPNFTNPRSRLSVDHIGSYEAFLGLDDNAADRDRVHEAARPVSPSTTYRFHGWCGLCGKPSDFTGDLEYGSVDSAGTVVPNWREGLRCSHCKLVNRIRAAMHVWMQEFNPGQDDKIYMTEQFGGTFRWVSGRFTDVTGSEYLGPKFSSGLHSGVRHEDIQNLSFEDDTFDHILSFDVLEHVPDVDRSFAQLFRVLKPGGRFLFTVPFLHQAYETLVRAEMKDDGSIVHHLPIELHGNPTDPVSGALCFRHFGWDTLAKLKSVGFASAEVLGCWSEDLALWGRPFVFSCVKPVSSR